MLTDLGRDAEAETDIKAVLAASPNDPQAAYLFALILARRNEVALARTVLVEAAQMLAAIDENQIANHPAVAAARRCAAVHAAAV